MDQSGMTYRERNDMVADRAQNNKYLFTADLYDAKVDGAKCSMYH